MGGQGVPPGTQSSVTLQLQGSPRDSCCEEPGSKLSRLPLPSPHWTRTLGRAQLGCPRNSQVFASQPHPAPGCQALTGSHDPPPATGTRPCPAATVAREVSLARVFRVFSAHLAASHKSFGRGSQLPAIGHTRQVVWSTDNLWRPDLHSVLPQASLG